ncbi:MAG TPA: hypothetical protein VFC86_06680 [Planctomycetota bacterium]|nr:hypothetical protein [Planctomycetota bacterium]
MMKTVRLARRDRGITLGVVILLVLVTMALCFIALAMWAKKSELNREKIRLQELKKAEDAAALTIKDLEMQGVLPTGLGPKEGEERVLSAEDSAKAVSDRRDVLFTGSKANPEYLADQYSNFQALVTEVSQRISSLILRHQRAELESRLAKATLEAKTAARPDVLKAREEYKGKLQGMIQEITSRIDGANKQGAEAKAALQAQVDKLKGEKETEEANFRDFERKETGKIRKMRNDLDQMRAKEVIKHRVNVAHGRVLKPDVSQKTAFIDLGSRERVVPGLRFVAARQGKEGKFEYKALLEVKKVWLDTAEVAIVKAYEGGGPVIDGDMIVNPFYNPRRPVIVAFAGHTGDRAFNLRLPDNNPKPLRLSAKEAANRIKEIGSEARLTVGLDADFVIFTEVSSTDTTRDAWPDYKKAILLEIPLADAADYYEFLGG